MDRPGSASAAEALGGWQAGAVPPGPEEDPAAGAELCALLQQLKQACGLNYDQLAAAAPRARNTVINYITKPGHGRDTRTLKHLLSVLGAAGADRDRALQLHRRTQPTTPDPADVGWPIRARAAKCTVWTMEEFTAAEATVHTHRHRPPPCASPPRPG
jgi:hypothetical protein